jgi:hypothetical protein
MKRGKQIKYQPLIVRKINITLLSLLSNAKKNLYQVKFRNNGCFPINAASGLGTTG